MDEKQIKNGIFPIKALKDNYIWAIVKNYSVAVIDPGECAPILDFVNKYSLRICAIFITHYHEDHISGIKKLSDSVSYQFPIYGPHHKTISLCNKKVYENDIIYIPELETFLRVLDVSGHTSHDIAYYGEYEKILFCGDTLFSGGCGRLYNDSFTEKMFLSLIKISSLPLETMVFCAHEYTLQNLSWAITVDTRNVKLEEYYKSICILSKTNCPTLPSSISKELDINPFLRTNHSDIIKSASLYSGKNLKSSLEVFSILRKWKNAIG
ncbi:hydroxyacylglutathione hydrolase [Candidatus Kinetoplastibacterium blastocrithidii TCC012E]|uniref:Hydroxyacylglutathione hydrolase n=1 Tax=Candidatus Kinetoplastidibacterium blastocrithidiae TCC012E TaxID=1208922 RepID=M1LWW8_9PROT|nr:hydroxyacylglutathione hydrolase [Candidatus Kinetoplastibacterium blastocrithidii]AFZ83203.1 hydroxyacylglutathione hydrolase [Candidatus Kinetoplastibacterium blastocrithidii (ex Strigomonas culicis)]AGF50017.1 hydroxyacylglutathione hydrolase [Candidatus Kinetoplastibacterium blastocrithidii TCC012E]